MKGLVEKLLRSLGLASAPDAAHDHTAADEQVVMFLPVKGQERVRVGVLRKDGDEYVFQYAPDFVQRTSLPPLPDFPERTKEYRSPSLWPFFLARLPPVGREDVRRAIQAQGIEPDSTLELLGRLGKKAISSPYELELARQGS